MIREERAKKQRAEAAGLGISVADDTRPVFPSDSRLQQIRAAPRSQSTITVAGQTYREVDNGRANLLAPVTSASSAAELDQRRRGVQRAQFMAENPLAGAAYGIATLFGAPPEARERALVVGGLADAAMRGAAPLGLAARSPMTLPRASVGPSPLPRPNIRYRDSNADGQATGVTATITKSMLGAGTGADPRLTPPGWQGNGFTYNEARGHLLAKQLGGRGDEPRNLVTLTQNAANSPQMSGFERQVARRVKDGEVVEYSATPLYNRETLPPAAMLLTAHGSRGAPAARIIQNPAGRRK